MIPFVNIPEQIRVPLFYAEVDNSQANSATAVQRGLIVGQMLATGAALPDVPILSAGSLADTAAFGQGSMALAMIAEWRLNDSFGELWVLPVADPAAAVAATGSVAFTGTATSAGLVNLYTAGIKTAIRVSNAMTAAEIATALAEAIATNPALPVTATAATGTLNLTASHGGALGNDIDIQLNFYGASQGEVSAARYHGSRDVDGKRRGRARLHGGPRQLRRPRVRFHRLPLHGHGVARCDEALSR